jgi:adenylate cyclase class 2
MSLEVEQKFAVTDSAAIKQQLAGLGAQFREPVDQVDMYFAHPSRSFAQTDEALRLRRVGTDNCITYKGPRLDGETKTRREIEIPFEPGATSYQQFAELLTALGFKDVRALAKRRHPGSIPWQGKTIEIALDEVAGLGHFVELEIIVDVSKMAEAQQCIQSLGQQLGLAQAERRSYLELLLDVSS